jgi:glycine dehydrogenase
MFGLIVQYPTADGEIYDYTDFFSNAKSKGIFCVTAADILSLTILKSPGEFGSDVAVGSSQRFGVPKGYGGPHAAYFACRDEFRRLIPGRIIGVSIDRNGNKAYRMALQTREQHIREKQQATFALLRFCLYMAGMYAVYHGPEGVREIAGRVHNLTRYLDFGLKELGFKQVINSF